MDFIVLEELGYLLLAAASADFFAAIEPEG
jgi:hypothetical protein